jgi:hypothetical protein
VTGPQSQGQATGGPLAAYWLIHVRARTRRARSETGGRAGAHRTLYSCRTYHHRGGVEEDYGCTDWTLAFWSVGMVFWVPTLPAGPRATSHDPPHPPHAPFAGIPGGMRRGVRELLFLPRVCALYSFFLQVQGHGARVSCV